MKHEFAENEPQNPMVHAKMLGAPEPGGVPSPNVGVSREKIGLLLLNRPIVDVHKSVIRSVRRLVREFSQSDGHLMFAENHPVDIRIMSRRAALGAELS